MSAQVDDLTVEQLCDAINELQKKQPYCHDPDNPLETLKTIGRYIDELQSLVRGMHMSGICDTRHREPCHMRMDGMKTRDVDDLTAKQLRDAMSGTRYFQRL